ncbi:signal peptide peptidase SppA [Phocaeicola fibrisolvens]|uniref:signal peptide peptidase SppA n=1 Tax=Phocaeicola fibrisolvens TaxID=2981793 RepID=UPI0008216B61|nr:signal peptide peptidase SppA [Phocaeicola fibrisolvens]MBU3836566.1 signal peptide peptidase SppA [Candidatus Phocaeicola merdigallinarum]MCU6779890.1 signal peptide peptidase SppA [Phocaeicola fibrisolvens]SCI56692.1 Protease 4 [uncultured Bacteroides sp.]
MKEFLRSTLATITGVLICGFIFIILGISTLVGIMASSETETVVPPNSVFTLELKGTIQERYQPSPVDQFFEDQISTYGLEDILNAIQKAKENDLIKGIYLHTGALSCSAASLQAIHRALADFKQSGKFLVAYADAYTQGGYYVASVADKVIVNPVGSLSWHGLASETMFLKDFLAKIGVKMQIFRVGTYKSAVEPMMSTEMSPANREQTQAFLESTWKSILNDVSASRHISADSLNLLADRNMDFHPAETYVSSGLADTLMYQDEVLSYLKSLTGLSDEDDLKTLNLDEMTRVKATAPKSKTRDVVAVYYAYGEIDNGSSSYDEGINSEKVTKDLRDLRKDKNVKAVVLRVNSPGGSAYGSEQIWREVSLLKAEKPVVVSMGDYAASGGYYISCAAHKIVAEPTTLTGSIGIFGMMPDASELLNDKLGLHFDGVKTHKMADMGSMSRPFNAEESALMQQMVNQGYALFTKRCAEGRHIPLEELCKIAEGRVWTGSMAKELKLVDELGGLDTAIQLAAQLGKVKDYNLQTYPAKEDFLTQLLNTRTDRYIHSQLQETFGEYYRSFDWIRHLGQSDRLQARLPFNLRIQ